MVKMMVVWKFCISCSSFLGVSFLVSMVLVFMCSGKYSSLFRLKVKVSGGVL